MQLGTVKYIYLIRHAKSSWKHDDLDDIERPLNKRGKSDAPRLGDRIRSIEPKIEILYSSPAVRAKRTAEIIAKRAGIDRLLIVDELYEFPGGGSDLIRGLDNDIESVGFVIHNPTITQAANELGSLYIENVPTSGLCVIKLDVARWSSNKSGRTILFDYPKLWRNS